MLFFKLPGMIKEDNTLPKIDIPDDFLIANEIDMGTLSLYTDYPCRIKAQVFIFCLGGELEAELNLVPCKFKAKDFATVLPDSIVQIKKVTDDLKIYVLLFSSQFMGAVNTLDVISDIVQPMREHPIVSLSDKMFEVFRDYFALVRRVTVEQLLPQTPVYYKNILYTISYVLKEVYGKQKWDELPVSRSRQILRHFERLVMQHYSKERSASFYAGKIGITLQHLCNVVKEETGETVTEIINKYVILDAKAQIKSSGASIQNIAYSLNFPNVSFFGKFFKKHVGMSPMQYRKK